MVAEHADSVGELVDVHMWIERLDTSDEGQRTRIVVTTSGHNPPALSTNSVDTALAGLALSDIRRLAAAVLTGRHAVCVARFTAAQLVELGKAYAYAAELLTEAAR